MRMLPVALLVALALPPQRRVAPERYHLLMGSGKIGSAFLVAHDHKLWAVMSVHQFEGRTPTDILESPPDTGRIALNGRARMIQKDVQAMPIMDQAADVRYLDYDPRFTLQQGESVAVLSPEDGLVPGTLVDVGRPGQQYTCEAFGVRQLRLETSKRFDARRASGAPVIRKSSGAAVGVVVTADQGLGASVVGFETLCFKPWGIMDRPRSLRPPSRGRPPLQR